MSEDDRVCAPKDCPEHTTLLQAAKDEGIDPEQLREILWLIAAHPRLMALPRAARELLNMIECATVPLRDALRTAGIDAWRDTLNWIERRGAALASAMGADFAREHNSTGHNPIRGSGTSDLPLYAVLCEIIPAADLGTRYRHLATHLLVAHVLAMREHACVDDYWSAGHTPGWAPLPNRLDAPARYVRRLSESAHAHALSQLPVGADVETLCEALHNTTFTGEADVVKADRGALGRFLEKAWQLRPWVTRQSSAGGAYAAGGRPWIGGRLQITRSITGAEEPIGDPDDPDAHWGPPAIIRTSATPPHIGRQLLESDLPPDEDESSEEVVLAGLDCEDTRRDLGAVAKAARAQARHIALANQALPWDYRGLALEEVAQLLSAIGAQFRGLREDVPSPERDLLRALMLLIHVMLWTGSSAARAADLRRCDDTAAATDSTLGVVLDGTFPIHRLRWRLRAIEPEYRTDIAEAPGQIRERRAHFDLPDHIGLHGMLNDLLPRRVVPPSGTRILRADATVLTAAARDWLRAHFPDGRITLAKIAATLPTHLQVETGDAAFASCIYAEDSMLARVQRFYTTPSIAHLQAAYSRVVMRIRDAAQASLARPAFAHVAWLPERDTHGAIGARLCPTRAAVRAMFDALRADVQSAAEGTDRKAFAEYHNLLTLFTTQFFGYVTTCRAIATPYVATEQLHDVLPVTVLSDKGDELGRKTRVVWIPDTLRTHMNAYDQHCAMTQVQLPKRIAHAVFFLDDQLQPVVVRPATLEPLLNRYLPVRANTHRRFVRTELLECGCPGEVVDALLGHWRRGQEPFGPYATFSFATYLTVLKRYLQPLLVDIGLDRPVISRLVA